MTRIKFDMEIMKFMSLFSSVTRTDVKDCFQDNHDLLTFIVPQGMVGKAVGKQGVNVKKLERLLNRKIKIVGFHSEPVGFVKNLVYPLKVKDITQMDTILTITPEDTMTRGKLIGRGANNLRNFESVVKRHFPITEIKVL